MLFPSCASQRPPSGGPPDTTPPRVVHVIPENNATLVPLHQIVEFEFSEGMDHKSLAKAIFITPDPGEGGVEYDWSGRRLRVEFEDSLKINRTYVITLGTDLKDSRGNAMKNSYTLAFSTGAEISSGKIAGQVFSKDKAQGILIWAYILEDGDPDPRQRAGDYATQTSADGKFELTNLSEGRYRVFAVQDNNNNRFFEAGFDALGVPTRDVTLSNEQAAFTGLNFRLALADTIGPALVSVSAQSRSQLLLRFDEALQKAGSDVAQNYKIYPVKSPRDSAKVLLAYLNEPETMEVSVITAPLTPKIEYEIIVQNLTDVSGNPVDPEYSRGQFFASALLETSPPKIVSSTPPDSARAVPLSAAFEVRFSQAMNQSSYEQHFQMRDSTGNLVAGVFEWATPALVKFKPETKLQSLSQYFVSIQLDSVTDFHGNVFRDSRFRAMFTTLNADTLAAISGTVSDEDATAAGPIYLKAISTEREGPTYELVLSEPGPYTFSDILPGTYTLEAFRDRNQNGRYDFGQAVPFQPAERFVIHPEKIQVRSRWPNEGNDIVFSQ
jgi:uncharacterized protein (DUF2141 family)